MQLNDAATHLQLFIQHHKLVRNDGIIAFEAKVALNGPEITDSFPSEIQVISLPKEKVLYVMTPLPGTPAGEMFRTGTHTFMLQDDLTLLITEPGTSLKVVITPVEVII